MACDSHMRSCYLRARALLCKSTADYVRVLTGTSIDASLDMASADGDVRATRRLGNFFPRHIHSRDATEYPFYTEAPDKNTLCGAIVSGPAVSEAYTDTRSDYTQSEAAIDYTGGVLCAFGAYAAQASGSFDACGDVRSAFTGRPV
jgi:Glycosyl hydrolase family 9